MVTCLSVEHVYKSFTAVSGSKSKSDVLEDINFSIEKGEIVSLIGPTGCGKTTLLRMIAGLVPADKGKIYVNDKQVTDPNDSSCALVFQNFNLLPWRNVIKNVEFGLEKRKISKDERYQISESYLKLVGLKGYEKLHPHELSGGMQQRVGLARALAVEPAVVLFDEPFSSVDLLLRESLQLEVLKILTTTNKTALFVTHNMREALFLSDRIITLSTNPAKIKRVLVVDLPKPRTTRVLSSDKAFELYSTVRRDLIEAQAPILEDEAEMTPMNVRDK